MHAISARVAFDGSRFLPGGATVLVDGTRIVGVEPAGFVPTGGVPVTAYDGTLLPGLVDTHVHLVAAGTPPGSPGSLERAGDASDQELDEVIEASLRAHAAAGVTTVRDLGDTRYRTLVHRDRDVAGLPRVLAAGPPVTVVDGHCHYLGGAVPAGGVERAVAERAERGVDVVKVMASGGFLTPGSDALGTQFELPELRSLVEAAHAAGLPVVAHTHSLAGTEVALAAGVDGMEHFTNLTTGRQGAPSSLLAEVAAAGIVVGPTLGSDMAQLPPLEALPPPLVALMASVGLTDRDEFFAARAREAGRLRDHGVRVVSGLDAGVGPAKPHGALWRCVAELVRGGWPVDEALATATSVPADVCGVSAGRLAPGLAADLLVVDGDLSRDVGVLARPLAVWIGGARA